MESLECAGLRECSREYTNIIFHVLIINSDKNCKFKQIKKLAKNICWNIFQKPNMFLSWKRSNVLSVSISMNSFHWNSCFLSLLMIRYWRFITDKYSIALFLNKRLYRLIFQHSWRLYSFISPWFFQKEKWLSQNLKSYATSQMKRKMCIV